MQEMTLRPLGDMVVIRKLERNNKTPGGLFIPDNSPDKHTEGVVLAVGEGARSVMGELVPTRVRPGERVVLGRYSGTLIESGGQELLLVKDEQILAVVEAAPGYALPEAAKDALEAMNYKAGNTPESFDRDVLGRS